MNLSNHIKQLCFSALQAAYPDRNSQFELQLIEITEATQAKFGHYQCNSAMKLAKVLNQSPRNIAEALKKQLDIHDRSLPMPHFSNIEIAGPGFINLTLNSLFLSQLVNTQLRDPLLGILPPPTPLKVIVDYSAPNTAKEMHVGHLRSTIIGDCLARIYRFLGHTVLPLNHIGDWGTQFGMLIAHLKTVHPSITEETPESMELSDLVNGYRASKKRFDEDPEFKKLAQAEVVALQQGDPINHRAWLHICAISRAAYEHIYNLLDIQLIERGESFYNPYLADMVQELEQKGLVSLSEGAKCVYLEGFVNREGEPLPLILQKSDGGYNYSTTDLAALKHRVSVEKGDIILYVVDMGQSLHFQMIFETARKAGLYDPEQTQITHVPFGLVLRPDGKKFKTRSGDTERLIDLIQVAIDQSKKALQERNPEMSELDCDHAAKCLGINAIKYADLSCHRTSDYVFSYEKMLRFEGNTAAFLLYAYVRIQSIQRKTNCSIPKLLASNAVITLEHPEEIAIALQVCQFNEMLQNTLQELSPNRITDYLYRLAEKFHTFFHHCRVEGSEQQNSRLLLCESVAQVLRQGFELLGLKPLEKM